MTNQQTNTGIVVQSKNSSSNWLLPPASISYSQLSAALQQQLVPVGVVVPYSSTSIPTGYLPCDGSNVSRFTYGPLFNIIGTKYGPGDPTQFSKFTPNMASNSQAGYTTSASSTFAGFDAFRAFNGTTAGNPWAANSTNTGYIQIQAPTQNIVTNYAIIGVNSGSVPTQAPRDWTLQGSNNGSTWTIIDTRTSHTDWYADEKRYFSVTNPGNYFYYRLNCTANNGDGFLTIQDLELYTQVSTSFTLPDMRGRVAIGQGTGSGLTNRAIGTKQGVETITLTTNQIPSHTHGFNFNSGNVSADHGHSSTFWTTPVASFGSVFAVLSTPSVGFGGNAGFGTDGQSADHIHGFSATTDNGTGSGGSHVNMQPALVVNFAVKY